MSMLLAFSLAMRLILETSRQSYHHDRFPWTADVHTHFPTVSPESVIAVLVVVVVLEIDDHIDAQA
jgi:hypothetical protein